MFEKLQDSLRNESAKLQGKTLKQKLGYIWDYYSLWIIGLVCVICFGVFVVHQARTALKEHWFYITITNTREDMGTDSAFWQGYVDFTGYDVTEKMVEFNDEIYFDYSRNRAAGNKYYEVFVATVDSGVLDAVTMEPENLCSLGESGRLMDLRDERCRKIYEKYKSRLLYSVPYDTEYSTDPVPVGIDISDSNLMTKYHIYPNGCAIGIGAQSSNIEAVEQFLDYIYSESGEHSL